MTWRQALKILVVMLHRRADNCTPVPGWSADMNAELQIKRSVYLNLAVELDYLAKLRPADGTRELRRLG